MNDCVFHIHGPSIRLYRRTKSQIDAHLFSISTSLTDPPSCHRPWPNASLLPSRPQEEGQLILLNLNLQIIIDLQIQAIVSTAALSPTFHRANVLSAGKASSKPPAASNQPSSSKPQNRKSILPPLRTR